MGLNLSPFLPPTRLPGQPLDLPVIYFEDFIGAYSGVDLALSAESDPTGLFSATADRGVWLISADTYTSHGWDPKPVDDADGGWMSMATDDDSGDHTGAQINGEAFKVDYGRRLIFKTRLKTKTLTAKLFVGLALAGATDPVATAPADYIALGSAATSGLLTGVAIAGSDSAGFSGVASPGVLAADTFTDLEFEWDGVDTVRFYKDGILVGSTKVNIPIGVHLSPILNIDNSGTVEEVLTVDYVLVINQRA